MMDSLATALQQLHFLRPLWLLLLPAGLLLAWAWRRKRQADSTWSAAVDAHLLPALLEQDSAKQRKMRRAPWLGLSFVLLSLALAGPAWRELPQPLSSRKAGLVVLLDLSDGMRASDLAPSRYARARFVISDVLRGRGDGQTGLLAYAGDAFVVAPLTDDSQTLESLLSALEPEVMPVEGQRLDRALRQGAALLHNAGFSRGQLLVLSYRADPRDALVAEALAADGMRVSVLGLGTGAAAPIPLPGGGFLRDRQGQMVMPRLDGASLENVAQAGEGIYVEHAGSSQELQAFLQRMDGALSDQGLTDSAVQLRYADEGVWLVLLALPWVALLFRRGRLFALPLLAVLLMPQPAAAFDWQSLWQRDDQRAWEALQQGQAEQAQSLARNPALRGSAAYRAGDYAGAEQAFAELGDAEAHYNRGNALAQAGELESALAAYDQALRAEPGMEDALHNRELVQQALQQQQEQQGQQDQQSKQDDKNAADKSSDSGSKSEGEEQAGQQGDSSPEQGEQQQPSSSQQQDQAESERDASASDDNESGSESDEAESTSDSEAEQAAAEAHREAIEQALKESQSTDPSEEKAGAAAINPGEAERQQAAEQWLRKIPDDPGGLLRRKFAIEHQRRQLQEQER